MCLGLRLPVAAAREGRKRGPDVWGSDDSPGLQRIVRRNHASDLGKERATVFPHDQMWKLKPPRPGQSAETSNPYINLAQPYVLMGITTSRLRTNTRVLCVPTMTDHEKNVSAQLENSPQERLEHEAQLAHISNQEEHEIRAWQSFLQYPLPSFWCVYACWCVILLSFDAQASGAVVGIPQFRKDFGYPYNGDYVLSAEWQSAFGGAPIAT